MKLILEDGTAISGSFFGYPGSAAGEVVFNTAMTGYPESLSDPSYKGQILVLSYPLIGNYGIPGNISEHDLPKFFESSRVQVSGLVVANYSVEFNHWNADKSLDEWLRENKVPALSSVDTRALTRLIREKGSLLGKLVYENQDVDFYDPDKENLVDQVCSGDITEYGSGKYKIVIVDCGVKNNIIRHVLKRDTNVIRVPWNYDFTGDDFDGVVVSNGPGNPVHCQETIEILSRAMKKEKPVMGICLGNQLMAMAAGAEAYKLKYGHRSHNQPVILKDSNKAYITSQNHGYAIRQDSLSKGWEPFFINLNDGTNEGIRHTSKPFFSVQFHPEASSGPTDTEFLFDDFIDLVRKYKLVTHA